MVGGLSNLGNVIGDAFSAGKAGTPDVFGVAVTGALVKFAVSLEVAGGFVVELGDGFGAALVVAAATTGAVVVVVV